MAKKSATSAPGAAERIAAAEFKARCLELMDRVRQTGAEYIVTKHGRPVARLVPVRERAREPLFGALRGTVVEYQRPFDPLEGDYDVNRD
jgi:prevent-host-death family protein